MWDNSVKWDSMIRPMKGWARLDVRELIRYRDLILLLVRRNFKLMYKQTVLGPAWVVIQPLITTVVFTVIFGGIAKLPTDGMPQFLFYMAGNIAWQYFSACLTQTSSTFIQNRQLFGKVYFPRLVVPLSVVGANLVRFFIQMGLFISVYLFYVIFLDANVHPNWYLCLFPLLLFMLAGLALGFGILISSLTTKYRDLTILFTFIVQLWMYATPVIYPLSYITSPKKQWIMALNPLTSIIETLNTERLEKALSVGGI